MADFSRLHSGATYVTATILCTVAGQLIIKWQSSAVASPPGDKAAIQAYLVEMLTRPWVLFAYVLAFLGSTFWMLALSRLPLSIAYPFMSLAFPLAMLGSATFFGEPVSWQLVAGLVLVMLGLTLIGNVR
jgi:multidrug transporter EmrE-like cation transporter